MIQEPQEPAIVEIPIVGSMNTTETTNSLKNITRNNKNQSIQNNKNRTTLIQIPKQNSKPRIFLLTRPAKPQLVRIATQSVQPHHEKELLSHHNPQKTATNLASLKQSKIVRIPFLPRSQVQTFSVKSNQANQVRKKDPIRVPIEVILNPNKNRNTVQASQLEIQKQDSILAQPEVLQYPIKQQVNTNQLSPISTETSNQLRTQQSVKRAIPQRTVTNKHLNLSENKTIQKPLTLTSMAGIELTGADMSLSQADMSGAMPPTATVEEINVPVFIDEYLQQATISTTAVSSTNNNIHYSSNNNNNNNNHNNNNQSNGKGNEVNNCLDTFENFEFDIDLLTENLCKDDKEDKEYQVLEQQQEYLQHNQQTQLTEVDDDIDLIYKTTQEQNSMNIEDFKKQQMQKQQQQLQLQLMLEDLLFSNNDNTNNIGNNSCKTNNNNNIIINTTTNNTTSNNNNNNTNNMAVLPEFFDDSFSQESLFKVAVNQMSEDILTPDDKELMDIDFPSFSSSDNFNIEEAVDFNNLGNDISLKDCFISSQSNQVMFSTGINPSQSALADISQEISEAEPTIPPERIHYDNSSFSSTTATTSASAAQLSSCALSTNDDALSICVSQIFDDLAMEAKEETKLLVTSLKRNGSQTSKHMEEKRRKLRLDIKRCTEMDLSQKTDINTPNVINLILQNDESLDIMGPADNSMDTIYHELISTSPQSVSVKSEIIAEDVTNDFSPPNTPYSVNSASNQTNFTGFINTAPNSPASSIATTSNTSITHKRGRGRPAKLHSDMPDISQLQHLSETDQKKILERIKNNEASRKSRLKHKEREIDLEKEENDLLLKNAQLAAELKLVRKMELKLQKALRVRHFQWKERQ